MVLTGISGVVDSGCVVCGVSPLHDTKEKSIDAQVKKITESYERLNQATTQDEKDKIQKEIDGLVGKLSKTSKNIQVDTTNGVQVMFTDRNGKKIRTGI